MSWIWNGKKLGFISEIELISEFVRRMSKKYELMIAGNLSEALPVLGAGMKTSVEVFPGHLEVGAENFHAFFFFSGTSFIFFSQYGISEPTEKVLLEPRVIHID